MKSSSSPFEQSGSLPTLDDEISTTYEGKGSVRLPELWAVIHYFGHVSSLRFCDETLGQQRGLEHTRAAPENGRSDGRDLGAHVQYEPARRVLLCPRRRADAE